MGAKGIFFAVFCIQKALGMLFLKTHLLAQRFTFFAKNDLAVFRISFTSRRNCFQEFNGLLLVSKCCRKAEIKQRKTRLIDLIKNQNYQWTLITHLDLDENYRIYDQLIKRFFRRTQVSFSFFHSFFFFFLVTRQSPLRLLHA